MRIIWRKMRSLFTFMFCIVAFSAATGQTKLSGQVFDSLGATMAHALVEAVPRPEGQDQAKFADRPNPWVQTNARGEFVITLAPGRYKIRAKDEDLGYPDPVYWLNADPTTVFPEIVVTDGEKEIADIRVVLGRRGGVLSGKLIDQPSGSPIAHGKVTLRDSENASAYVEVFTNSNGHFEFTVPSKPIIVSASAAGYRASTFASGAPLLLSPGEHREITLDLGH